MTSSAPIKLIFQQVLEGHSLQKKHLLGVMAMLPAPLSAVCQGVQCLTGPPHFCPSFVSGNTAQEAMFHAWQTVGFQPFTALWRIPPRLKVQMVSFLSSPTPCSTQVASAHRIGLLLKKEASGRGRLGPSRKASVVIITLLQRK